LYRLTVGGYIFQQVEEIKLITDWFKIVIIKTSNFDNQIEKTFVTLSLFPESILLNLHQGKDTPNISF